MQVQLVQLGAGDGPALMAWLGASAMVDPLLLSRLARLGGDPRIKFWALRGQKDFLAVLAADGSDWVVSSPGQANAYPLAELLDRQSSGTIRGEAKTVGDLLRQLKAERLTDRTCLLVRLSEGDLPAGDPKGRAKDIRHLDHDSLASLFADPGMSDLREAPGLGGMSFGSLHAVALYDHERPAALAWTEAEASNLARIGGLWTVPSHRRQGWGLSCLWALCQELSKEGITSEITYDDPAIGRLVGRLGFRPSGRWRRVDFRKPGEL